ncbi:MAG: tyrosine-type recombinase/integrase [Alphaproteobacteria bacterium]
MANDPAQINFADDVTARTINVSHGRPARMAAPNLLHRMRGVMRKAKVLGRSPCHAWRHTGATQLLDSGQSIKTVQRRLGHASLTSTAIYLHPVDERDAEAADSLGALLIASDEA